MNLTGIIVEYNPLHSGHIYHIKKSKEITKSDGLIAIMSGNFVQRGIPAIVDKWTRTKMALLSGVDLVLELPCIYSLSSAEFFAFGAVSLLNNLGIVNNLCFGSEIGEPDVLMQIAVVLSNEPKEYKEILKKYLEDGIPYPSARKEALKIFLKKDFFNLSNEIEYIIGTSNNILGIEYCKSIIRLKSSIKSYTIKRLGSSYNCESLHNQFSSASAIRKFLKQKNDMSELKNHVPLQVFNILMELNENNYNFVFDDTILPYIKYKYFTNCGNITNIPDVTEGIHNKIYKALNNCKTLNELIMNVKSKRYTYTRINRILCQYFIGFDFFETNKLRNEPCPYARVLGLNKKGAEILKNAKKSSSIPIYTKLPKNLNDILKLDINATKAYSLLNSSISPNADYLNKPIIIK